MLLASRLLIITFFQLPVAGPYYELDVEDVLQELDILKDEESFEEEE